MSARSMLLASVRVRLAIAAGCAALVWLAFIWAVA